MIILLINYFERKKTFQNTHYTFKNAFHNIQSKIYTKLQNRFEIMESKTFPYHPTQNKLDSMKEPFTHSF